jgi:hypothetical protein
MNSAQGRSRCGAASGRAEQPGDQAGQQRPGHAHRGCRSEQQPVGLGDPVGVDQVAHRGHVGDLEDHPDRLAGGQHQVEQPDLGAEGPDQRDEPVQHHPGQVAADQNGPPVQAINQHTGADAGAHRGHAGHAGQQAHLRDRTGGPKHQQRDRDVGERVACRGQRLAGPEDREVAVAPQRPAWLSVGHAGGYLYRRPCSTVARVRSLRMSWSVRENEVTLTIGFIRCRVIDFGRVNSRSPSAP